MPQQEAFGALQVVVADVIRERAERFEHLAGNRFWPDVLLAHPRMFVGKGVEGRVNELAVRLGILKLFQLLDALVEFDAGHFHLRHFLALKFVQLFAQDEVRVFQNRFNQAQQHQRIIRGLRIDERDGFQQVQRERLVHRKILLQLDIDPQLAAVVSWLLIAGSRLLALDNFDNSTLNQRAKQLPRPFHVRLLCLRRIVAIANQPLHRPAAIPTATEHVQQHSVRDLKAGSQTLRDRGHKAREGVLVPRDKMLLRRFAFNNFLAVARSLLFELEILDHVFRRLGHNPTSVVEALAPGASGDLVKIPGREQRGFFSVEFAQAGEEHGANGHIDADAQCIGAANDFEQSFLRQLLDQHAIFRQQAGMVQTDAVLEPFANVRTVGAAEFESFERIAYRSFFLPSANVDAGKILRALPGFQLGEMHHIDRRFAIGYERFQSGGQRQFGIGIVQWDGPLPGRDGHTGPPIQPRQRLFKEGRVAQSGRHQQKTRLRQSQQWHLPRHPPLAIGVVMELINDDLLHVCFGPFAQCDIRQDFCRATKDRRIAIDRGISGAEAYVLRAELTAQRQPFFIHERFDRAGINRAFALSQSLEMETGRDQRFS